MHNHDRRAFWGHPHLGSQNNLRPATQQSGPPFDTVNVSQWLRRGRAHHMYFKSLSRWSFGNLLTPAALNCPNTNKWARNYIKTWITWSLVQVGVLSVVWRCTAWVQWHYSSDTIDTERWTSILMLFINGDVLTHVEIEINLTLWTLMILAVGQRLGFVASYA